MANAINFCLKSDTTAEREGGLGLFSEIFYLGRLNPKL